MTYIWELADWPKLVTLPEGLLPALAEARLQQGRLLGALENLGFQQRQNAQLSAVTEETLRTSEIEGEILRPVDVRSSVARRLGVADAALPPHDRKVEGVVEMVLDATTNAETALTAERLFGWHAALFPDGRSGMHRIRVGTWRDDASGPMQVVSGPVHRQRVHYQAPPATRIETEMAKFLAWFAESRGQQDGMMRAGLAHFWFVTIHPFEDGNGRIARAIADMALAQDEQSSQRFYSVSAQINREKKRYYDLLERSQKQETTDVTDWTIWFLDCIGRAAASAGQELSGVLARTRFWQLYADLPFNERQRAVLNRLFHGFEGALNAPKWAALTRTSDPTARRDIAQLAEWGILVRGPGGSKNTNYVLAPAPTR